ncbi:N-acetylglucosamine-6-phosphate deacetylase [Tellurirhabdus bombi]|uniref:N-acetylglucosamine-6-phosphate deacetylase n=1 Tax=Tellurirhabdus bombi TaxID=2907205 RepID=UPI001F2217E2|nr:N-acetylglucosamine-6-phosphate deacetylase [Tellurirhabdus bombi]
MAELILQNATVFTGTDVLTSASIRIDNGLIQEVVSGSLSASNALDLAGQWLIPGLVDLQAYGGSEVSLNEQPTARTVAHIYETHRKGGTTSILPTLYSSDHATALQAIAAVREEQKKEPLGVLGLHLEGPYVSLEKRGVHSAAYVRESDSQELSELIEYGKDVIRLLTIAPECFTEEQLQMLKKGGIRLSAGHTNATYQQATAAFDGEVALATHLYNAMRGFESREPGVVGAVFDHPTIRASIVADGFHNDFAAIRIAHRLLKDRLFLISDAMSAAPPRPQFVHEELQIQYDRGRYVNQDGRLAGSSITLLEAVQNCIQRVGLEPAQAFRMASTIPAKIIGLGDKIGKIQSGYTANLIVLDSELALSQVMVNGSFIA